MCECAAIRQPSFSVSEREREREQGSQGATETIVNVPLIDLSSIPVLRVTNAWSIVLAAVHLDELLAQRVDADCCELVRQLGTPMARLMQMQIRISGARTGHVFSKAGAGSLLRLKA